MLWQRHKITSTKNAATSQIAVLDASNLSFLPRGYGYRGKCQFVSMETQPLWPMEQL